MQKELTVTGLKKIDFDFHWKPEPYVERTWVYLAVGLTIDWNSYPGLILVDPSRRRITPIHSIKYFAGKIRITSCEEAINFVRLLTAPRFDGQMDDYIGYEVMLSAKFHPQDWLGEDPGPIKNDSGYCGLISDEDATKIDFSPIECRKDRVFHIKRYILERKENGLIKMKSGVDANLLFVQEEVSPDGDYKMVHKRLCKKGINSVNWSYSIDF
jgi:hypothetical protein